MMRIGLFCQEYPPRPHGGIGTFVQTLAEGLAVQGHRVTVVELGDHPGERRQAGVEIVTLPLSRVPKIGWLLNRLRLRGWVRDAVRQGRMDIFELPEFEGWMPFGGLPCPVVVRLHLAMSILRAEAGLSTHRVSWGCEYLTLKRSDCWIGVSGYVLDLGQRFFGLTPTAARVIHNPVGPVDTAGTASPKTTAAEQDKGAYCLFVGNMLESKGVLTLARAMRGVFHNHPELRLVVVGADVEYEGGPISHRMLGLVGEAHRGQVLFTGHLPRTEALEWMRGALLVCLPSRLEAFGLVPLEAMALGVPVIFTRACSGPEIIRHGIDGLLVDPQDHAALAREISGLVEHPEVAARLGRAGKETVTTRFTLERCITETLACYRDALAARAVSLARQGR